MIAVVVLLTEPLSPEQAAVAAAGLLVVGGIFGWAIWTDAADRRRSRRKRINS